ncbi:MAG: LysM peptidoglycan-binding domain-containing protein [Clostridia bacterium]|jgi:LysM repeat protein|nr:LysM peptidoglycan-binding domain-containing protein [Clostridia bacterium]MCI9291043.1 LysM peptidoglycan-binding domain-containing protein [Clostridia bacterium]
MSKVLVRVQSGMTLESLAEEYHTSVYAIRRLNNLQGDIFVGMRLVIEEINGFYYTVQPFDTLESVAKKFSVSEESIAQLNGVERIFIGQKIFVGEK